MSFFFSPESMILLSTRFISRRCMNIHLLSCRGFLDIKLVSYPPGWNRAYHSFDNESGGKVEGLGSHDLYLAERVKDEILEYLCGHDMPWLRRPFLSGYSMFIRQDDQPVLFWQGRDTRE